MGISSSLFVAHIPRSLELPYLQALFNQYGTVIATLRPRHKKTSELRSFAFITMSTPEEAVAAIKNLHGYKIDGLKLVVKFNDRPMPAIAKLLTERVAPTFSMEAPPPPLPPPSPPLPKPILGIDWKRRREKIAVILPAMGTATLLKTTVMGRPGHVEIIGHLAMMGMNYTFQPVTLPRGVPTPSPTVSRCIVYMGVKQWRKVSSILDNPEDMMIIEGHLMLDNQNVTLTILATSVQSKLTVEALRQKRKIASLRGLGLLPPEEPSPDVPSVETPSDIPPPEVSNGQSAETSDIPPPEVSNGQSAETSDIPSPEVSNGQSAETPPNA